MNWSEIFENAKRTGRGGAAVEAKAEARRQIRNLMVAFGNPDPNDVDCYYSELYIEMFCDKLSVRFD